MGTKQKRIRIKLENSSLLEDYAEEIRRWVSEGGNPSSLNDIFSDVDVPLKKGQVFEVTDAEFISENDAIYYEVEIKDRS